MQKTFCIISSSNIWLGHLLDSPQRGDSNTYPNHMFYEEKRIKQGLSYISFCPLRILYNSKIVIMATSLGTNVVVVTRVRCTNWPPVFESLKLYCILNTGTPYLLTLVVLKFEQVHFTSRWCIWKKKLHITKRCPYNFDPLKPHFYIVKLGFTGIYIIFLILLKKT